MDLFIKSTAIPLHGYAISKQGGRPENQDDMGYAETPLGCLLIVCDGMGGGPGGRTASFIVKNEIVRTLQACASTQDRDLAFRQAAAHAHQALEAKMKEVPELQGMGSTFAAILINKESAVIAHAGDSRVYQLRGKRCVYRSIDHSLVAELVQHKALTEEQARISPQSNVITRGLGSTQNHVPEVDVRPYKRGDRFVICTDGVWGSMPQRDLLSLLTQRAEVDEVSRRLSEKVDDLGFAAGGTHDNHTLIMAEVEQSSRLKPRWHKWVLVGGTSVVALLLLLSAGLLVWHSCTSAPSPDQDDVEVADSTESEVPDDLDEELDDEDADDAALGDTEAPDSSNAHSPNSVLSVIATAEEQSIINRALAIQDSIMQAKKDSIEQADKQKAIKQAAAAKKNVKQPIKTKKKKPQVKVSKKGVMQSKKSSKTDAQQPTATGTKTGGSKH
jgi:serine/threonine protein phosphatase PrpC